MSDQSPTANPTAVLYHRNAVSPRAWAYPLVVPAVLIGYGLVRDGADGTTFAAALGASAPVLLIWWLTLWSLNRYGAVTLTRETLRVGRDTVPVSRIEPQWVRMLARKADPSLAQRLTTSATTLQLPGDREADTSRGRLLGGAYGSTLGDDLLTLELHGNERVSVPTRDRRGLLAALLTAVGEADGS